MSDFENIRNVFNTTPALAPKSLPKANPGARGGTLPTLSPSRPTNPTNPSSPSSPSSPSQMRRLRENSGCSSRSLVRMKSEEELISKYDNGVMHHDTGVGNVRKNTYNVRGASTGDAASIGSAIPKAPQLSGPKLQPARSSVRHQSSSFAPLEPSSHHAQWPGSVQKASIKRPLTAPPCLPPDVNRLPRASPKVGGRGERTPQRRILPSKAELGPPPAKPPRPPEGLKRSVLPLCHEVVAEDSKFYKGAEALDDEDIYDDVETDVREEQQDENPVSQMPRGKDVRRRNESNESGDYDDILTPGRGQVMYDDDSVQDHRGSGEYDDVWLPESACPNAERDGYFTVGNSDEAIYDDIDNYGATEDSDCYTDGGTRYCPDGAGTDAHVPMNSSQQGKKSKERQPDKKNKTRNKELLQLQKKFHVNLSEESPVICYAEVIQPKTRALKKLELAVATTDKIEILHLTDEYAICRNQQGKYGYVHTRQLHTSNMQELLSSEMYADVAISD